MTFFALAFDTGNRRRPQGLPGKLAKGYAAAVAVWAVYAAGYSLLDALSLTILFLASMLVLAFVMIGPTAQSDINRVAWYDWALAGLAVASGAFFATQSETIAERITLLTPLSAWDIGFALLVILLTLEVVRRTVGLGLTVIVVLFIVYNLYGDAFSGALQHGEISLPHFIDIIVFTTDGLFGVPLRVAATYAFLFVLFGTILAKTGGSEFFFNIAAAISGRSPGGPAKIAVISSGLYGTVSGSPTSDVVTTGSVTIPMMQRLGYSKALSGAVEVAASTGGSLVPPVMGAAAFIMAEYTGIDYVDIIVAAIIPALLYYLPIYTQVHLHALKIGLKGMAPEDIPPIWKTLKEGCLFLIPIAVIVVTLLAGYTPTFAGLYGTFSVLAISFLRRSTRLSLTGIIEVLAETSVRMIPVMGACAAAGLVIGGVTMTGLAAKFSNLIFLLSGADLFLSLLMAAVLTILLGMGMPTPSAYILAAVLVAPVMIDLKIDLMAGHMFLLYFAVMSALTPPVAVAAYAASAIADENPLKIAAGAVRMALGAFLIPFTFVYNPALLLKGTVLETVFAVVCVGVGLYFVAVAVEGYFRSALGRVSRLTVLAAGILLLFVDPLLAGAGVGLAAAVFLWERGRAKRANVADRLLD